MSKKNKAKPTASLSPEAYIKQRARSLPIFECYISDEWDKEKIATIVISRKHSNGNITAAFYLVDLLCMGVKESYYRFNEIEKRFRDILDEMNDGLQMIKTDYNLVHNVIHAANEFAEEFGLHPCREFTKVTQYMLEEDTDDIELMEIECGMEGKPAVVFGHHNKVEGTRILNHLHNTVGEGNYYFIEEIDPDQDEDDEDDDWEVDEEWEEEDEEEDNFEALKEKFIRLYDESVKENSLTEDFFEYIAVSKKLLLHFADPSKTNNYLESLRNEFDLDLVLFPDAEIFGIDPTDTKLLKKCNDSLEKVMHKFNPDDPKRVRKSLKRLSELQDQIRDLPFFELLAGIMHKYLFGLENDSDTREEFLLTSFVEKYPQHPVSKIIETREKLKHMLKSGSRMIGPFFRIRDFFGDRKKIHLFEFKVFMTLYEDYILEKNDVDMLCALDEIMMEKEPDDLIAQHFAMTLFRIKEIVLLKKLHLDT